MHEQANNAPLKNKRTRGSVQQDHRTLVQHIKGPDVSVDRAADAHEVGLTHGHDHYGTDYHGVSGIATQLSHGSGEERAVCADDLHNWVKPSGAADTEGHVSCNLALVLVPHLPQQFSGRSSNGGKVLRIGNKGSKLGARCRGLKSLRSHSPLQSWSGKPRLLLQRPHRCFPASFPHLRTWKYIQMLLRERYSAAPPPVNNSLCLAPENRNGNKVALATSSLAGLEILQLRETWPVLRQHKVEKRRTTPVTAMQTPCLGSKQVTLCLPMFLS